MGNLNISAGSKTSELLLNFWRDGNLFLFCIIGALASPLISPSLSFFFLLCIYVNFLFLSKSRVLTAQERAFIRAFLLIILLTILFVAIHKFILPTEETVPKKTFRQILIFAGYFAIIDAVQFQVRYYKIPLHKIAYYGQFFIFAVVHFCLCVSLCKHFDLGLSHALWGSGRVSSIIDVNPNHSDDVFVYYFVVLVWMQLVLLRDKKSQLGTLILSIIVMSYFVMLTFYGQSKGAIIGIVLGGIVVGICLMGKKVFKPILLILFISGLLVLITQQNPFSSFPSVNAFLESKLSYTSISSSNELSDIRNTGLESARCFAKDGTPNLVESTGLGRSFDYRITLYKDAINIWWQKPFFGHGDYDPEELIANYNFLNKCYLRYFSHIHSYYLDAAIRGGIFILLITGVIVIFLLYKLIRLACSSQRNWSLALPLIFYFVYLVIENLFDMTFIRKNFLSACFLNMAILVALTFESSSKKSEEECEVDPRIVNS